MADLGMEGEVRFMKGRHLFGERFWEFKEMGLVRDSVSVFNL